METKELENGRVEYSFEPGTTFEVTGVDVYGRRFHDNWGTHIHQAFGINLWNGTLWCREPSDTTRRIVYRR